MFKKKEHCSFYGSTNFIWSDNYVIEKEACCRDLGHIIIILPPH